MMPRKSFRKAVLEDLESLCINRQLKAVIDLVLDRRSEEDDDTVEQVLDVAIETAHHGVANRFMNQ